jgi:hypothetical protein
MSYPLACNWFYVEGWSLGLFAHDPASGCAWGGSSQIGEL